MRIAAAALALTACSSQPEPANLSAADARDPGGDNSQALPMPAPSATVAAALPAPRPAQPRTFRDWTVACDNANRCAMASLGPDMGDFPEYTMEVARNAGPSGGYEIALATTRDAAAAVVPASIAVDGKSLPIAGDRLSGVGAQAIVEAMANGTTLDIRDGAGRSLATVSLAGASAALRFIDAAQGRAGGVTATVAKGDTPAAQVPAAPAVPVVAAPALGSAPAKPSAEQLAQMKRIGQCAMPEGAEAKPETAALGDGATLVVLPCSAGAYNVIGALFVIREGQVAPADTDAPAGFDATGADSQTPVRSVVNGTFDGGLLTSYAKGRGLGDCGVSQGFAWDGTRLRLVEQSAMIECRGNPNFLRTWHARVVRP